MDSKAEFGEAKAFYTVATADARLEEFVVYRPIVGMQMEYRRWRGKWGTTVRVARVASIAALIGIWVAVDSQNIHILRKHPGLDLLSEAECGLVANEVDADS